MNDDEVLRRLLAEPGIEGLDPAFTASVLFKLGARRRRRRHLLRLVFGGGIAGAATILAPGIVRSLEVALSGPQASVLATVSLIVSVVLALCLLPRRIVS
jgi:hypothetical protein